MTDQWRHRLEDWIRTACVWEAEAPKAGNVHPAAAFNDLTFHDFVSAATAAAPHLSRAGQTSVGASVLEAVRATRAACGSNVNLGICLLIAPLAAVPEGTMLVDGIRGVLDRLTAADAANVYEAIRLANPGGLGKAPEQDVAAAPTCGLVEAMQLAAERDRIAWNYANAFEDVVVTIPRLIEHWTQRGVNVRNTMIVAVQLDLLSRTPDSLIARKCGAAIANEASQIAKQVLDSGWPSTVKGKQQFEEFDRWLRADGHRRNPGTTADLLAAALFAVLRDHPAIASSLSSAPSAPLHFHS